MKYTKICPKCRRADVIDSDKRMGDKVMYHKYVCLTCGYTEMFATDKHLADLKKLRDKGHYD